MKSDEIAVSCGLLSNKGKYLIQRRTEHQLYPGVWEFPGGKQKQDERPVDTLRRELNEEIGIVSCGEDPVAIVPYRFHDGRSVRITYYTLAQFEGMPIPKEGQVLQWVPIEECMTLPFLEPDKQIIQMLHSKRQSITWDRVWMNDRYSHPKIRALRAHQKIKLLSQLGFEAQGEVKVLEVGCGSGANLIEIARMFPYKGQLIGCDISPRAIDLARTNIEHAHLQIDLHQADASNLPFNDNSIDIILCIGVLEHVPDKQSVFNEIDRILKPDGTIFFSTSSKYSWVYFMRRMRETLKLWPYGFMSNYTPQEFSSRIGCRFTIERMAILQTDFDFLVSATIDRLIHLVLPLWGRYVLLKAKKRKY